MEVKLFEVRDRATFMPVMAVKLATRDEREAYLLGRAGYAREAVEGTADVEPYVILVTLVAVEAEYDPFQWSTRARTLPAAHQHIIAHWDELKSGDVVDVEYVLGETQAPKVSEMQTAGGAW